MSQVKALIISGYGTNCERETAFACGHAGAACDIVHISEILNGKTSINDYHFLNLAGGFLDGDDLGSAQVESVRIKYARIKGSEKSLFQEIKTFIDRGMLIMGVCNGFQALVKSGLLPGNPIGRRRVSLTFNDSAKFEDRWVRLSVNQNSPCIFTDSLEHLYVPVRHGEGKFVYDNDETISEIEDNHMDVLHYADTNGNATMDYPSNPNGSMHAIAGICDKSGRIFGLMPHPEAYTHRTNHPLWTRIPGISERGEGMALFDNAVSFLKGII